MACEWFCRTRQPTPPALVLCAAMVFSTAAGSVVTAQIVVPGTGSKIAAVGDDFEDTGWSYLLNSPKSSRNIDDSERSPLGHSRNGRWLEGPHRGTPDLLRIVPTPRGGIQGSSYALQILTRHSGIPGTFTRRAQQDDLMVQVKTRLGRAIPVSWEPSCVVRVYVPPFSDWENRSGVSFGFRTDLYGSKRWDLSTKQYWPGIFFAFQSNTRGQSHNDTANLLIRADAKGRDLRGPEVTGPGWWTLGMSVSRDGKCHFFARQGVADLTAENHLTSQYCYGFRAKRFELFFFNILSMDDGQTWSTPWIIDDPTFYCAAAVALNSQRTRLR